MFMSRITLSPLASLADIARVAAQDAYSDHRMVWAFFPGPGERREFLFRRLEQRERPAFLVVAPFEPVPPGPAWHVEVKPYDPAVAEGDVLAFSLRANPVVRRRDGNGRQVRHDVVMDAKARARDGGSEAPPRPRLIQQAGSAWLAARAPQLGFELLPGALRCEGYRQHRLRRRGRTVTFSSLDMEGLLRVTDPGRFRQALFRGIGPSKAFGCGLLLVRRA